MKSTSNVFLFAAMLVLTLAACGGETTPTREALQVTLPGIAQNAPVYTATFTITPSYTPTPTETLTPTFTLTPTPTLTLTPTLTPTLTETPTPSPTQPLLSLTPASAEAAPAPDAQAAMAGFSEPTGWSCDDFPCEDDIDGFLQRIQVPAGYSVSHVGRFPGKPQQITYGNDGRLYATVWENGGLDGAVYVLDSDGTPQRYSQTFYQPIGLAFQPGTDVLYVSGRVKDTSGAATAGGLWRVLPNGHTEIVIDTLPCCYGEIGQQPNGLTFGPDGYLYLGLGALTDQLEPPNPQRMRFAALNPLEASVLRIQPHTAEVEVFASGIRNPFDLAFSVIGDTAYVTDNGILNGPGDRLLAVKRGGHYGWPYWRSRGCEDCPFTDASLTITPDLLSFPDFTLPRGVTVYTGTQFPRDQFGMVFVALWHGTPNAQRIVRVDPAAIPTDPEILATYHPDPFVTGLIRPVDLTVAPDGSLVVADYIYGHIWRVSYGDAGGVSMVEATPQQNGGVLFITSTPRP